MIDFTDAQMARWIVARPVAIAVLLFPPAMTLLWWRVSLRAPSGLQVGAWLAYRRLTRFVLISATAAWWSIWDATQGSDLIRAFPSSWFESVTKADAAALLFWIPPTLSLGLFLALNYSADRDFLKLRWSFINILSQASWRLVSIVLALLMVAAGFNAIYEREERGFVWIFGAGLVAMVGMKFLRRAEGIKLHTAKSGELRNRAASMARRMRTYIERVYIVPAGKGHLTNAFGMSHSIGLTDNLGKYLTHRQVDYVIAHELAHVKLSHGAKLTLTAVTVFLGPALLLFALSPVSFAFRPVLDFALLSAPMAILYFYSRRFEYAADRQAVEFTGDPETAIGGLAQLHLVNRTPAGCSRFTELFMTHPSLTRRARVMARAGQISEGHAMEIMNEGLVGGVDSWRV